MRLRLDSQAATVYVPIALQQKRIVKRLAAIARKRDRSVNYLVVEAILEYLDREEGR